MSEVVRGLIEGRVLIKPRKDNPFTDSGLEKPDYVGDKEIPPYGIVEAVADDGIKILKVGDEVLFSKQHILAAVEYEKELYIIQFEKDVHAIV